MNTTTKGMSNSGAIHLLLAGSNAEAACATGKVRPRIVPLTAAEGDRPLTCKRCLRIAANEAAAQTTAAIDEAIADAEQAQVDGLLAEATGLTELDEAGVEALAEGTNSEATDRDAPAAIAAAEAAPQVPTQKRARVNQKALVLAFLEQHRGEGFTPHAISKAVTPEGAKALGLRDVCARLAAAGELELVEGAKAATYRLPLDAQYADGQPADDQVDA